MRQPRGGQWISTTWAEFRQQMLQVAAALREMGLQQGDRVAILGKNCAEWFVADLALQAAGLVSVPIYATASSGTISYVLKHSGAKAVFIGGLDDFAAQQPGIPDSVTLIAMPDSGLEQGISWDSLLATQPLTEPHIGAPDEMMTLIYTSGSTGHPKGVMISYGNYHYGSRAPVEVIGVSNNSQFFSYLPLAHITERAVLEGVALYSGSSVDFNESQATFSRDLQFSQPTFFISVPRLWMRFQSAVLAKMPQKKLDILLRIPIVAGITRRKIRKLLGLSRAEGCASGSAPISADLLRWYACIGVQISEGWGMSETSGVSVGNFEFNVDKLGSIGKPVPGTEIKLSEDGEILIRGAGVFKGYYRDPERTAESFTDDWFHTGDKGEFDKDGCLRISGRVKDLFKTGKGKYVVPVPIEGKLCVNQLIDQVCVMGSGRKQPVAVVVLSAEVSAGFSQAEITASLAKTLGEVNARLEGHMKMDAIFIVKEAWTIENGLLTPTLKIKRAELEEKYHDMISADVCDKVVWAS